DKVSCEEVMGKGGGMEGRDGKVVAGFDGEVEMILHRNHVIGVK
ncbi:PTS glucose transporter subunit IIA, partial [Bacillus altitudinis]